MLDIKDGQVRNLHLMHNLNDRQNQNKYKTCMLI